MADFRADFELCEEVFNHLERGLNMITTHFPSGTVKEKEAIIEETEELLRMVVSIEPIVMGLPLLTNSRLY